MKRFVPLVLFASLCLALMISSPRPARAGQYHFVPNQSQALNLQQSLYPDFYATRDAAADIARAAMIWRGASQWLDSTGPVIAGRLTSLSGLLNPDSMITVLPLWYYPALGNADPFIVPVGGFQDEGRIEASLWGEAQRFQFCYLLALRHLLAARAAAGSNGNPAANSPLLQPGSLSLSLLGFHLAWTIADGLLSDSARAGIAASPFWRRMVPGLQLWEDQLKGNWALSDTKPLTLWLQDADATQKFSQALLGDSDQPAAITEETIPSGGILGLVFRGAGLVVNTLDTNRLAWRWGLRVGDQLIGVDAAKARTQKEVVEQLLTGWDRKSGRIAVIRKGKSETVYIRPVTIKLPGGN